jgi:protein-disulfide isomerase
MSALTPPVGRATTASAAASRWSRGKHALLFANQDRLAYPYLRLYAQQLQLDTLAFDEQMRRSAHLRRVRDDLSSGVRSGVNGTPTFFINGQRYDGVPDLGSLLGAIESLA